MKYNGALPYQLIVELVNQERITGIQLENIRPGSFDPALTEEVYRVRGAFLPGPEETVRCALSRVGAIPLPEHSSLEVGCTYVVRLDTEIKSLLDGMYGYGNPKSSAGRVDLHVRFLADHVSRYDYLPKGYKGSLWLMIVPRTFPVVISPGITLSQIRLCTADTRLDETQLELAFNSNRGILFDMNSCMVQFEDITHSDRDGSILLTLGLSRFQIPGFEAIENGIPIDLSRKNYYDPKEFFRTVIVDKCSILLRQHTFYILSSNEAVRIDPKYACEMRPMDDRAGDMRTHYAGFVDPGWGCGEDGQGRGRPLTLEVRSFETKLVIRDGQPVSKIRLERMVELPERHYDQMNPTYGIQTGPKLGKYFKEWK